MGKKHILFVDDEQNIIDALKRMLRKQRNEWDMAFVRSGPEALALMTQHHFDVIVTDMKMPDMSGADLLEEVRRLYPDTARIVLSGHCSSEPGQHALKVAHQFMAKPVDAEQLKQAVARASLATDKCADHKIRDAIASLESLPTLPTLYAEITEAAESETGSAREIAAIISRDMSMSAKLLQLVNSSFFGIGRKVSSIEQTVALLGITRIKALVLSESVFKLFAPTQNVPGFSAEQLWNHSMQVAEVARLISREEKQGGDRPDQAFTAGVLHDLGELILVSCQPEAFKASVAQACAMGQPMWQAEADVIGVTHAQIAGYLLNLWGLPPRITEAVELHHTPNATDYDGLSALTEVHVADVMVSEFETAGTGPHENRIPPASFDLTYLDRIGYRQHLDRWREVTGGACERAMEART